MNAKNIFNRARIRIFKPRLGEITAIFFLTGQEKYIGVFLKAFTQGTKHVLDPDSTNDTHAQRDNAAAGQ
jgi:hypothetical protein